MLCKHRVTMRSACLIRSLFILVSPQSHPRKWVTGFIVFIIHSALGLFEGSMFYKHLGALRAHKNLWLSQKECLTGYRLARMCNTRVILNAIWDSAVSGGITFQAGGTPTPGFQRDRDQKPPGVLSALFRTKPGPRRFFPGLAMHPLGERLH